MLSRTLELSSSCADNKKKAWNDSTIMNTLAVVLSVVTLLLLMKVISFFASGIINTVVCLFAMIFCMDLCLRFTGLKKTLGVFTCRKIISACFFIAVLGMIYYCTFINSTYLSGNIDYISNHTEHQYMYTTMKEISSGIIAGDSLKDAAWRVIGTQYYYIFSYCSLIYIFNEVNILNMCIWNTMHLFITAVMVTLAGLSVRTQIRSKTLFFLALLQPFFLMVWVYNKVIVGQTLLALAVYLLLSTRKKNIEVYACSSIVAVLLMWVVRLQYAIIAIVLSTAFFLFNTESKRKAYRILMFLFVFVVFFSLLLSRYSINELLIELNIITYLQGANFSPVSLVARLIRGLLPYFPWTEIFNDEYAYFSIYSLPQEILNISLWGITFYGFFFKKVINKGQLLLVLPAFLFFLAGIMNNFIHTGYVSMGSSMIAFGLNKEQMDKLGINMVFVLIIVLVLNILYFLFGFTGSGITRDLLI